MRRQCSYTVAPEQAQSPAISLSLLPLRYRSRIRACCLLSRRLEAYAATRLSKLGLGRATTPSGSPSAGDGSSVCAAAGPVSLDRSSASIESTKGLTGL